MRVLPSDVVSVSPTGSWIPLTEQQMMQFCSVSDAQRLVQMLPAHYSEVKLTDGSFEGAPFHGQVDGANLFFLTETGPRPWRIHGVAVVHGDEGAVTTGLLDEYCADILRGHDSGLHLVTRLHDDGAATLEWASK